MVTQIPATHFDTCRGRSILFERSNLTIPAMLVKFMLPLLHARDLLSGRMSNWAGSGKRDVAKPRPLFDGKGVRHGLKR